MTKHAVSVTTTLVGILNNMFAGNRKTEPEFQEHLEWPEGATRLSVSWTTPLVLVGAFGRPVSVKPGIYEIYRSSILKGRYTVKYGSVLAYGKLDFWKKQVAAGNVRILTHS